MSWLRYMTLYSFVKYNPDWEVVLYTSDSGDAQSYSWSTINQQDFVEYKGDNYIHKINDLGITLKEYNVKDNKGVDICPSQKSNFFKWNLLATTGGFYADMDILFLRSINDIYEKTNEFDVGICFTSYYSIGFMFSNGNNKFFSDVYNECFNKFEKRNYQGAGVHSLKRWPKLIDVEKEYGKIYNIPFNLLYQYNSHFISKIHEINSVYKLSLDNIGLHWYAGHPLSQNANNSLNENNYYKVNSLLSRTLKGILNDSNS